MTIPVIYNLRSLKARAMSTGVAVFGVAGAVTVFVATLAMADGFVTALTSSASEGNAIVMRAGATSEIYSTLRNLQVLIIEDAPGVARDAGGPLASAEVVELATFPLRKSGADANIQVRGVSPRALKVHTNARLASGRFFTPGMAEVVLGRNVPRTYRGLEVGRTVKFGGGTWTIVGVLDAGGSAFDSELWCDAAVLNQVYQRPDNAFESVTVRLCSRSDMTRFRDALTTDPRLTVQVESERDYYEKTSRALSSLLRALGLLVAAVMATGAVLAALNTMYSSLAQRAREVATLRALGFGMGSVIASFVIEAQLLAAAGGVLGCVAALPMNGYTTEVMNWDTVSHVAFAFRITPGLLLGGFVFALTMGLLGGFPPALRAARRPIATALREI